MYPPKCHRKFLKHHTILLLVILFCSSLVVDGNTRLKSGVDPQARNRPIRRTEPAQRRTPNSQEVQELLAEFRAYVGNGCYESALLRINNVAAWYYDRNLFEQAMQSYQILANFADPVATIDPSDDQEEAIRKSTLIKDMLRNYAKFMLNTQQVHPELCRTTNCVELAWGMMEKVKSRLLRMDLINSSFSRLDVNQKELVRRLITRLKAERIARSQWRLATGKLLGPTEKDAVIEALETDVARYLPDYTNLAGELATLQRVKESLTDNETLLSFVYTNNERKVYLFRVEKNGPVDPAKMVIKTDLLTANLYYAIEDLKKDIIAGKSLPEISRRSPRSPGLEGIYEGLLQKLDLPPNRRLIIATDQNLSALPFDLLPWKNGQRMGDVFDINYVPSATVFYYLRSKRFAPQRERNAAYTFDYVGFGYAGEEADRLIHTETEIENSARNFSRAPNLPNASEADIYRQSSEIANSKYLHFATHNYFKTGVDASFYLAFGHDADHDGHLTSQEIIIGLRNRSELTVLSSCETAQANDNYPGGAVTSTDPDKSQCGAGIISNCVCSYGESFSNLSGAFFAAGSKQLLLTQWKIPDDSFTGIFISRFFAMLSEGKSPSDALKQTKKVMSDQKPLVWAGFMLAGD